MQKSVQEAFIPLLTWVPALVLIRRANVSPSWSLVHQGSSGDMPDRHHIFPVLCKLRPPVKAFKSHTKPPSSPPSGQGVFAEQPVHSTFPSLCPGQLQGNYGIQKGCHKLYDRETKLISLQDWHLVWPWSSCIKVTKTPSRISDGV